MNDLTNERKFIEAILVLPILKLSIAYLCAKIRRI